MSRAKVTAFRARAFRQWMREGAVWRDVTPTQMMRRGFRRGLALGALIGVLVGFVVGMLV